MGIIILVRGGTCGARHGENPNLLASAPSNALHATTDHSRQFGSGHLRSCARERQLDLRLRFGGTLDVWVIGKHARGHISSIRYAGEGGPQPEIPAGVIAGDTTTAKQLTDQR